MTKIISFLSIEYFALNAFRAAKLHSSRLTRSFNISVSCPVLLVLSSQVGGPIMEKIFDFWFLEWNNKHEILSPPIHLPASTALNRLCSLYQKFHTIFFIASNLPLKLINYQLLPFRSLVNLIYNNYTRFVIYIKAFLWSIYIFFERFHLQFSSSN